MPLKYHEDEKWFNFGGGFKMAYVIQMKNRYHYVYFLTIKDTVMKSQENSPSNNPLCMFESTTLSKLHYLSVVNAYFLSSVL